MKTAVSIPDELFQRADRVAARRGISRSQFYAEALRRFLVSQEVDDVTARLNAVYAKGDPGLDPVLEQMQFEDLPYEVWEDEAADGAG